MGWMYDILIGNEPATVNDLHSFEDRTRALINLRENDGRRLREKEWQIAVLKDELGRHKLAIEALTRFLIEEKVIEEDKLLEFVKELDAEDGVIDGKLTIDRSRPLRRLVVEKRPPRKMIVPGAPEEGSDSADPSE